MHFLLELIFMYLFLARCGSVEVDSIEDKRSCFDVNPASCQKMARMGFCKSRNSQASNQLAFTVVCCRSCRHPPAPTTTSTATTWTSTLPRDQFSPDDTFTGFKYEGYNVPVALPNLISNQQDNNGFLNQPFQNAATTRNPFDYNQNYHYINDHATPQAAVFVPQTEPPFYFPPSPDQIDKEFQRQPIFFQTHNYNSQQDGHFEPITAAPFGKDQFYLNENTVSGDPSEQVKKYFEQNPVVFEPRPAPLPQQYQDTYPYVCLDYNHAICTVNANRGNCVLQNAFVFDTPFAVYCCQSCRPYAPSTVSLASATSTSTTPSRGVTTPTTTRRTSCVDYDSTICAHWASQQYCNNYGNFANGRPLLEACAYSCGCRLYGCGIC
jgi:hypothetical protein